MSDLSKEYTGLEIAVIGASGKFPGARNVAEFWDLLQSGKEGISSFNEDELRAAGVDEASIGAENFVPAKGIIDDIECFDHAFFGYSAREAELLDPQVRIFLECTWEALEDAGYDPHSYSKRIGMFAGANPNLYWTFGTHFSGKEDIGDFANKDLLSTRVSYKLDLKGPSYTVFTACSTSLVTIHQACRSLLGGECDMAIAGGISIELPQVSGYYHHEGMILSKDGHNRSFDKNATGAVFSNGAGVVVLKPLEDAIRDKDNIYAVVKGTAVNNDGNRKVGYPAPSVKGQAEVIQDALQIAEIGPESICYVEAHGSATAIGDPIEVEALQQAFNTTKRNFCAIGSVKSNLGHTNIASGVAGFLKTVLAIKNRFIPATINFEAPNPKINFDNSPFYVLNEPLGLTGISPIRAGVSSFGVGGTNAHAIIEEGPDIKSDVLQGRPVLLRFSAHNADSQVAYRSKLANFITTTDENLRDIAFTLQVGRHDFRRRQFLVCSTKGEAAQALTEQDIDNRNQSETDADEDRFVVFMFPGQGAQYNNMGLDLYHNFKVFRTEMDRGLAIINAHTQQDMKDIWFMHNAEDLDSFEQNPINQTQNTQPLLFAFEYALGKTMMALGIQPNAMIGHSFGEFVAACLAGVFSLEDALRLVIRRGELIASLPEGVGGMMSIAISENELIKLLPETIDIAAINSDQSCVISGEIKELQSFKSILEAKNYSCRELRISNAFHSRIMEPILEEFRAEFDTIQINPPQIPFMSNLTGQWATEEAIQSPQYWVDHLRKTVNFQSGLKHLIDKPNVVFLEIGPGTTLSTFVNQARAGGDRIYAINLIRHPKDEHSDEHYFLEKLGALWLKGVDINWNAYYEQEERKRVSVPTYAFNKTKSWLDEVKFKEKRSLLESGQLTSSAVSKLYKPTWIQENARSTGADLSQTTCILVADKSGVMTGLRDALKSHYAIIIMVRKNDNFSKADAFNYAFNTEISADWRRFFDEVGNTQPIHIGYAGLLDHAMKTTQFNVVQDDTSGFSDMLEVLKSSRLETMVCWYTQQSTDAPITGVNALNASLYGKARWIAQHTPNLYIRRVELDISDFTNALIAKKNTALLAKEFVDHTADDFVCIKSGSRSAFRRDYSLKPLDTEPTSLPVKNHLLVGALNAEVIQTIGHLQQKNNPVGWVNTTCFPPEKEWPLWLEDSLTDKDKINYLLHSDETKNNHVSLEVALDDERKKPIEQVAEWEQEFVQTIQTLSTALVYHYFETSGISMNVGAQHGLTELKETLKILPRFYKFFDYFIHILEEDGLMSFAGDIVTIRKELSAEATIDAIRDQLQEQFPSCMPIYDLVIHCTSSYGQALSGQIPAIGVLFPDGSSDLLDAVAQNDVFVSSTKRYFENLKSLVDKYINEVGDKKQINILEVGAGRGELTQALLPMLKGANVHYYFTDIGQTFVQNARKKWADTYDFVSFKQFDICDDPSGQGFEPFSFDLILAFDVIHSTPSLADTISNLHHLLVPGGWMGFIENTSSLRLVNLVWGLADGWWEFTDHEIRTTTPLVNAATWLKVMEMMDFEVVANVTLDEITTTSDHDLLLMQAKKADTFKAYQHHLLKTHQPKLERVTGLIKEVNQMKCDGQLSIWQLSEKNTLKPALEQAVEWLSEADDIIYLPGNETQAVHILHQLWTIGDFASTKGIDNCLFIAGADHHLSVDDSASTAGVRSLLPSTINLLNLSHSTFWSHFSFTHLTKMEAVSFKEQLQLSRHEYVTIIDQFLQGVLSGNIIISNSNPTELAGNTNQEENKQVENGTVAISDAPKSEIEQQLAAIWNEVFGTEYINRNDNYFELGGDSLMMVAVIARIEKTFKTKVKVKEFYNHPTVAALSKVIASKQGGHFVEIKKATLQPSYPATSAQKTMFYLQFLHPEGTSYNITQVMELEKGIDIERLTIGLNELIERHETLRTIFILSGGEPRQVVLDHYEVALDHFDICKGDVHEAMNIFIKPFDLLKEPCFRVALAQDNDSKYLMVDLHHILCDGISIDVLKKELSALYNGNELAPLELQFKDYATWQNSESYQYYHKEHEQYWHKQFSQEPPILKLPYDFEKQKYTEPVGEHYVADIEKDLFKATKALIRNTNTTLFGQLMTITYIVLAKYAQVEDIVIGTGTVGRNFPHLDQIIGNFVNTVPIRSQPQQGKSYRSFSQEVQHSVNEALENQDYPYEDLITHLPYNETKENKALFNVAVTLVSSSLIDQSESEEVRLFKRYVDHFDNTSKFDIDVNAVEKKDRITIVIEYASLLFQEQTMASFFTHLKEVLEQATVRPDIKLKEIELSGISNALEQVNEQTLAHDKIIKDSFFDHKY
ncbi:acyltransferase domain-containing protein [Fulvivirga sp. M361]|uniref:type I polyketide synthase n=1 Tax=Fulvivirga sp. M361 TaxID=2594266 RepID=UPI00117AAAE3|nr:type I polyketide synthase [Fulvivirga sp. M361]TRX53351.1 acyltransferase domain-containing protein [Fulvivirga sp. M361]